MDDSNILPAIRGEYIASASHQLPDPNTSESDTCQSTIDVPDHGRVTFTFERFIHRRGRDRFAFWTATRAVKAG